MSALIFCFNLYRANPGVYRVLSFPGTFTVGELTELLMISVGLPPAQGEFYKEDGHILPNDSLISGQLKPGDSGKLLIRADATYPEPFVFHADFVDEKKEFTVKIPFVEEAYGNQLPAGVPELAVINRIHQEREPSVLYRMKLYSNAMLKFSAKKTDNEIRRRFAPETAVKLVNPELGLPTALLAENIRNQDLKYILDCLGKWYDSQERKTELVRDFCDYWREKGKYEKVISNMSLSEFLRFRELATAETLSGVDENELPFLASCGLIAETKKGLYFSRNFLEYYAEQLEKKGDDCYYREISFRAAVGLSCAIYGIFSAGMFRDLLNVLCGGSFTEAEAERVLKRENGLCSVPLLSENKRIYYHADEFAENEVLPLWKSILHEPGSVYLPDRAELIRRSEALYSFSEKNEGELEELEAYIRRNYFFRDRVEKHERLYFFWHRGGKAADMASFMNRELLSRWNQWTQPLGETERRYVTLWAEEAENFPQVLLGGYSRKNCPLTVLEHFDALEQEKKNKAAEQEQKKAAKTGTAAKKRGMK